MVNCISKIYFSALIKGICHKNGFKAMLHSILKVIKHPELWNPRQFWREVEWCDCNFRQITFSLIYILKHQMVASRLCMKHITAHDFFWSDSTFKPISLRLQVKNCKYLSYNFNLISWRFLYLRIFLFRSFHTIDNSKSSGELNFYLFQGGGGVRNGGCDIRGKFHHNS